MLSTAHAQPVVAQQLEQATTQGTTFWNLFFSTYSDPWSLVALAVGVAIFGMVTHWAKKFYKNHTSVGLVEWFFIRNRRASILAFISMIGALFASFAPLDYTTITTYQVVTQAWAIGYAADSAFNSDET